MHAESTTMACMAALLSRANRVRTRMRRMKFVHKDQEPHFREYLVILVIATAGTLLASGLVESYVAYREHMVARARWQRESARSTAATVQSYFDQVVRQIRWTNPLPPPGTA